MIALCPALPERAYNLLILTAPFNRWKLQPSSTLRFAVSKNIPNMGELEYDGEEILLRVSQSHIGHLSNLLITVAHEMCHLRLINMGVSGWEKHDAPFIRLANKVCSAQGWDVKGF